MCAKVYGGISSLKGADRKHDSHILARVSDGLNGADIENISLAARRRTILGNLEPSLAKFFWQCVRHVREVRACWTTAN